MKFDSQTTLTELRVEMKVQSLGRLHDKKDLDWRHKPDDLFDNNLLAVVELASYCGGGAGKLLDIRMA